MSMYGREYTFKVVYELPPSMRSGFSTKGVALVEAVDKAHASSIFKQQYAGQFFTISSIDQV